jgi:hypothetical protein
LSPLNREILLSCPHALSFSISALPYQKRRRLARSRASSAYAFLNASTPRLWRSAPSLTASSPPGYTSYGRSHSGCVGLRPSFLLCSTFLSWATMRALVIFQARATTSIVINRFISFSWVGPSLAWIPFLHFWLIFSRRERAQLSNHPVSWIVL